jgi:hypothetical protein
MKKVAAAGVCLALAVWIGRADSAEALKSGPQVGNDVPGQFEPFNVTGDNAGKKSCQVCKNGPNPVVMIFAREVSGPLTKLIKKVDAATSDSANARMGSFVVFCTDEEAIVKELRALAAKEKLGDIVLTVYGKAGPEKYKLAKDADVTVVLYTGGVVKSNYAFRKGELSDKDIDKILDDLPKILAEKK